MPPEFHYPCSGRVAMSETDLQALAGIDARHFLKMQNFRDRPDVYVSGNLFVYHEQGNRKASVSPDILVALGRRTETGARSGYERRARRRTSCWRSCRSRRP